MAQPSVSVNKSQAKGPSLGLLSLMVLFSGMSGLIYESLWVRSFGLIFGNTAYAVTVVLATFMGGLALGGFWVSGRTFKNALNIYGRVELGIGALALLTFPLLKLTPYIYGSLMKNYATAESFDLLIKACFS